MIQKLFLFILVIAIQPLFTANNARDLSHSKSKGGDNLPKRSYLLTLLLLLNFMFGSTAFAEKLIPMGHTIEVELELQHYFFAENKRLSNGEKLLVHDTLLQIDGKTAKNKIIESYKPEKEVVLTVQRKNEKLTISCTSEEWQQLKKVLSNETDGIGTLTYISESKKKFGAVGHQIDIGENDSIKTGVIHLANIQSVVKSEKHTPGYKIIAPVYVQKQVGEVKQNTVYGVFGQWDVKKFTYQKPLETAAIEQVNVGPAYILTQIQNSDVEKFEIKVTNVVENQIEFEILDKRLLSETGGIVQGMSGSPVIQGNYLIGAVTHMYVENPKKGAAISIDEMVNKSQ